MKNVNSLFNINQNTQIKSYEVVQKTEEKTECNYALY